MRLIRARVALAGGLVAVAGTVAGVVLAAGPSAGNQLIAATAVVLSGGRVGDRRHD